jgi:hypothetical protein
MTEIFDYADHDEDDLKRKSSRPSPEEGHRLVLLFLSVERADLREEIFDFVEGIRVSSPPQGCDRAPRSRQRRVASRVCARRRSVGSLRTLSPAARRFSRQR